MVYVESPVGDHHDTPAERFNALVANVEGELNEEEISVLRKAFTVALSAHEGQVRASGEPYVNHVISVADILTSLRMDMPTLAAALLHDVVEDTHVTLHELELEFGEEIAKLVDSVTKMRDISSLQPDLPGDQKKEGLRVENLRKLLLAMAEDVRVVLIKLADRLHNMRTLDHLTPRKQHKIAKETAEIYAPLANRLGIWQLKWELEDLSFRYQDPDNYKRVAKFLDERRVDREDYIQNVVDTIDSELNEANIHADVTGRPKHIFSIWRKMQRKRLGFHQLYDIRAVRIHVDKLADCYHALGIVHTLWRHIPHEFDDYIATPKENNYQSIHTAVIGPEGKTLEIQIRTHDMHHHAEFGVAAHWRYKEGGKQNMAYEQKIAWLRQLLDWKDESTDAGDFIDRFKSEVFQDRVYVMTPTGDVVDLPQGATPLDFAFYVHTEVGSRCRGAKVNARMVPLTYELKSGEQVQILTASNAKPSRDWLNPHLGYLKTSRARAKVRHWFRQQDRDQNLLEGREVLDREIHRLGMQDFDPEVLLKRFRFQTIEELYVAIGNGDVTSGQIINALQSLISEQEKSEQGSKHFVPKQTVQLLPKGSGDITIYGEGNLLTQIAQCCNPVPGDEVVGYITKNRGVSIHRQDCSNMTHLDPNDQGRLIEVEWNDQANESYTVIVEVQAMDRQGLLRDISTILANLEINVVAVNTVSNKADHTARMQVTLEIAGLSQLSRALSRIGQLPNVIEAHRVVDK